jgi:hypothetical protein
MALLTYPHFEVSGKFPIEKLEEFISFYVARLEDDCLIHCDSHMMSGNLIKAY